jgi:3-(3-hydroxy-phenyl)propionate hydroxylase
MSATDLTSRPSVLIIGAGPVGLTLANELARRNVRVRIIDKAHSIREVSKALILHVRTQECLASVGVMPAILAEARPLTQVLVHAYGKHIGSWNLDGVDGPYRHPVIIGQNRTQHCLLDALARRDVEVEWSTEATQVQTSPAGVSVTLKNSRGSEAIAPEFVVGCEGSRSLVRSAIGATFEGDRYEGEQFIQADCKLRWSLPSGRSYLFLTEVGYLMVIEMPGGIVRVFISLPDGKESAGAGAQALSLGATEDSTHAPTLAEVQSHLERLSGYPAELSDPIWLARYRTSHRYANTFGSDRAFIAGDSAHVHVPIGGQGMNTGIQDAFNLGWKLAGVVHGTYRAEILNSYSDERQRVAVSLIRGTDFAYRGILHPSELKQRLVRTFGPFVIRTETAQDFMRSTLEEIRIAYDETPLNHSAGSAGPVPGHRMPAATLVDGASLTTITAHDLATQGEWLVFAFLAGGWTNHAAALIESMAAGLPRDVASVHLVIRGRQVGTSTMSSFGVLLDPLGEMHDRFHASSPCVVVVRPDQVVAYRGPLDRTDAVSSYFAGILASDQLAGNATA